MLTRSCFSMLPQRLPPGHSVQSPPAERQLCYSNTRKSIGPSAPIAYAASVSPPDEAAACRGAQVPRSIIGRKLLAGVPRSIIGKSLLAETDQNPHKEAVYKETAHKKPHTKKPCTRNRAQKNREQKKPCTKKTVHGGKCARDGNRTRTDISAHRILSPACLPIPPLEQCKFRLEGQRYYFLSSYEPFLIYFCNLV